MELRRLTPTGPIARGLLLALAVLFLASPAEAAKGKSKKNSYQKNQRRDNPQDRGGSSSDNNSDSSNRSFSNSGPTTMSMQIIPVGAAAPVTSGTTASQALASSAPNPPGDVVHPSREIPLADLNTTIVLSLNNVPLDQLMRFMAETTGKTIMKQRDLNTNVTVNAPRPISKRQALELIYAGLQLDNIYVAEQDNLIQLINFKSLGNIKLDSIPSTVDVQQLTDSLRIVRKIYKFDGANPEDARRHLELYMPNTNFSVDNRSNTLIITDQLSRIKTYDKIIQTMNQPPDDRLIEIYKLTKANASELCQFLRPFISNNTLVETTETLSAAAPTSATLAATSATLAHTPGSDVVLRSARGGGGEIILIPDSRSNWIVALVPRSQKAGLDRLISEFDIGQTDDRLIQVYKLENIDAPQLISMLTSIIANRGLTAGSAAGADAAMAAMAGGKPGRGDHGPRSASNKMWQRMAESMAPSGSKTASAGDVVFLPETRQNWIIAIMRPDLKPQLDELVKQFDIPRNPDVQLRMIDLEGGNASALASTLSRLIGEMPVSGPLDYIRLVPSEDNARLMVMSSEANYKKIQDLIKIIGTVPTDRTLEIYPVKNTDASQLLVLVNAIISNKGLGKLANPSVGAPNTGVHGSSYYKRMADNRGEGYDRTASQSRAGQVSDVMLMAEPRLNWIIAIMRPDVKADLEALLTQFDVPKVRLVKPHIIEVAPGTAFAGYSALYRVFSELANNNTAADFVRLYPQDDGNHILAFCSEENLKSIEEVIKTIGMASQDRTIQVFQIMNTDAYSLGTLIARVLPLKGRTVIMGSGAADVSLAYDQRLNWLIAIMKPEAKPDLEEAIKQFDVPKVLQVKAHKIPVDPGTASSAYYALYNVYSNLFSNNSPGDFARFYPSEDGNSILAFCTDENLPRIEELVKTIGAAPTDRIVQLYPIVNTDAYTVVNLIQQTLPIKGKSVKVNVPGGDVTFSYDYRLNWVIAVMKTEMKKEIDELVKQFDVPKTRELQVRTLDIKGGNAAFLAATLTRILAEQPSSTIRDIIRVMPTEDNSKLIVLSTEANFKTVQDLIETIGIVPNNRVFEIYQLTNADAGNVISMIYSIVTTRNLGSVSGASTQVSPTNYSSYRSYSRHLADAMTSSGGQTVDLTMLPDMRLNWIIAVMKPEMKTEIDALVKKFDIPKTREVQLRSIDIKGGNATNLAGTLTRLIAGMPLDDPRDFVRIAPSDDNAKLLVMSSEANFQMVQDLIGTVGVTPSNRMVEIYKLKNADPSQIVAMVQAIITNRGLGTTSNAGAAAAPSSYGSPRAYYRHMAEGMSSSGGGGGTADLMMIPDARLKWIVAIMKPELKKEVDALILQFDQAKDMLVQVRVLDLEGGNASTLAGTLTQLVADMPVESPEDAIKILPSADNGRLIVVSSEANYKVVQEFAKTIGTVTNNRVVQTYKLIYADPLAIISTINSIITSRGLGSTATGAASPSFPSYRSGGGGGGSGGFSRSDFFRRMSQSMSSGGSSGAGGQPADLLLIPEPRLKWIVAIMKPELKTELEAIIKQFDVESAREVEVRTIDLKDGNATAMIAMLSKLLVDEETDDPAIMARMVPSDDNARIFITSNQTNYKLVQDLIQTVGINPVNRLVETYKLASADPSALIQMINTIVIGRGLGTTSAASPASGSSSVNSSGFSSYRQFYRRLADTAATGVSTADLIMVPEPRLRWVIAIMKPSLKTEVDGLVKQFDVEQVTTVKTHMVEMKGGNAARMSATLDRLVNDYISNFMDSRDPNNFVRIQPSDDNARLIVMSNDVNFKMIQDMITSIGTLDTNRVLEVYKLTYAQASSIITLVNSVITNKGLASAGTASGGSAPSMMSSMGGGGGGGGDSSGRGSDGRRSFYSRMFSMGGSSSGAQNVDVLLIPETRLNWVIALMKPELKKEVDALIKQFDVEKIRQVQPRTVDLKNGNGITIGAMINSLLAVQSFSSDPTDFIRITPTTDNSHLIVMSSEANYKAVQELIAMIGAIPNNRIVETYKLVYADVSQIATTINSIITNKGAASTAVASSGAMPASMMRRNSSDDSGGGSGGSGGSGGDRASFFNRMSGSMTSMSGSRTADLMLIPDMRLNWLVAIMKPELKTEVEALIKQFDVDLSKDITARMIEIKRSTPVAMAAMISGLIQDKMANSGNPRDIIRVTPADDGLRLLVMSTEANFKMVQDLVTTIDEVPDDRVVDIYKLTNADAGELINLLNNIISKSPMSRGSGSTMPVGGGSSSSGGNSLSRYSRFLGSGGPSGSSGSSSRFGASFSAASSGAVQIGNIILIPETRLNWIITICPKDQKAELDGLVKQFDIQTPDDFQMRVAEVQHVDANDVAQNLTGLLQQQTSTGGGRRDLVRVTATDDGQRLLVWSTESKFKDIQAMIKTLDVDIPKDVQARMIDIKFAEATNLATTMNNLFRDSFFMGGGNQGKREFVRVSATDDGNRLLVMSSESNYKIIQDMIKQLDTADSESQVTKVFKIEHLEAQTLADQLTTLFQERSRTQSQSLFGFVSYGSGRSSGSGTIPMPSIVPSPRTNTIMVMTRPKDLPFIEAMIKELDVPMDVATFEPRIYHIQNTDANEVVTVLQSLFAGGNAAGTARSTTNINYYLDAWRPNRSTGAQDSITAIFGKLQFVVDRVTNTIVVLASNTKNYEIIDKVIEKLDQPDPENSEVLVVTLKYADALKLADQLNYLFSEGTVQRPNATPQTQRTTQPANSQNADMGGDDTPNTLEEEIERDFVPLWGNNPNARAGETERPINSMIGKVRVVPDIRSNKLTVAAPPVFLPSLKSLIESLDHPEPQVYITTRIIEITRGNERRIGLRWTPDPKTIDPAELDNSIMAMAQLGFLDSFGATDWVDKTKPNAMTVTRTVPPTGGGTVGGLNLTQTLKNGSSVISANVNIALLVQLLVKNSQSRVYTEPGVTVNNNETGNIFFGSEYPFRTNVNISYNGNQNVAVRYRQVGINLDIRPHINGNDEIVLKVAGENSSVRSEMIDGAIIKDTRQFTTEVSLKSGETVFVGGILIDDGIKTRRGIPILGSIPILKYIFGKDDQERSVRELVFFITPEVLVNSQDTRRIVDNTTREMNEIEKADGRNLDKIRPYQDIPDLNILQLPARVPRTIRPDAIPEVQDEPPPAVPRQNILNPSAKPQTAPRITQDDKPLDKPKKLGEAKVITGKPADKPVAAAVPDEDRAVVVASETKPRTEAVIIGKVSPEIPPD